jgi:hypothetical protein
MPHGRVLVESKDERAIMGHGTASPVPQTRRHFYFPSFFLPFSVYSTTNGQTDSCFLWSTRLLACDEGRGIGIPQYCPPPCTMQSTLASYQGQLHRTLTKSCSRMEHSVIFCTSIEACHYIATPTVVNLRHLEGKSPIQPRNSILPRENAIPENRWNRRGQRRNTLTSTWTCVRDYSSWFSGNPWMTGVPSEH